MSLIDRKLDVISDDLWIDILLCLNYQEFTRLRSVSSRFYEIASIHDDGKYNKKLNAYWRRESYILCSNLDPAHSTPNWFEFYVQLKNFFHVNKYIAKYNKKQNKQLRRIHQLLSISKPHNEHDKNNNNNKSNATTKFKPLKGFSPNTKSIALIEIESRAYMSETEKVSPLIQCCKGDSPMIFETVFDKHKHLYKSIDSLISYSPPQTYRKIEITVLTFCILHSIKYGSVNMVKYLLTKYSDQVLMHCPELINGDTSTLLIEAMKSCNNEIIRAVLKHDKMNNSIMNFANNGSKYTALHQACCSYNPQIKKSERLSKRTIKLLIDKMNVEKVNQRGVASIYIGSKRKYKNSNQRQRYGYGMYAYGQEVQRSKVIGSPLLIAIDMLNPRREFGRSHREAIPYFTNIIIKQLIHCDKVNLNVLDENNKTPLINACMVKDNVALHAVRLLLGNGVKGIDFSYSICGWNVFHFAVLCYNDKVVECLCKYYKKNYKCKDNNKNKNKNKNKNANGEEMEMKTEMPVAIEMEAHPETEKEKEKETEQKKKKKENDKENLNEMENENKGQDNETMAQVDEIRKENNINAGDHDSNKKSIQVAATIAGKELKSEINVVINTCGEEKADKEEKDDKQENNEECNHADETKCQTNDENNVAIKEKEDAQSINEVDHQDNYNYENDEKQKKDINISERETREENVTVVTGHDDSCQDKDDEVKTHKNDHDSTKLDLEREDESKCNNNETKAMDMDDGVNQLVDHDHDDDENKNKNKNDEVEKEKQQLATIVEEVYVESEDEDEDKAEEKAEILVEKETPKEPITVKDSINEITTRGIEPFPIQTNQFLNNWISKINIAGNTPYITACSMIGNCWGDKKNRNKLKRIIELLVNVGGADILIQNADKKNGSGLIVSNRYEKSRQNREKLKMEEILKQYEEEHPHHVSPLQL